MRVATAGHLYFAFLSYSHSDEKDARWLHSELEKFRVPRKLIGHLTENGPIPKTLAPVFRDVGELPASGDLSAVIQSALAASRNLVVLCSPTAAHSRWTNKEIEAFKALHPDGTVLAAIVGGEPFASDIPGHEEEECLPPALRQRFDRKGRPTGKRAEPLAADLRGSSEERRTGFLKLVAGLLGLGLDDLVQRDQMQRQRRGGLIAAASLLGMIVTSGLAIMAVEARDVASEQRQQAEGLVEFMLTDLREELEPIGRLDALDSVGAKALAYYRGQDPQDLDDDALAQRSRALSLMGEIALTRGDLGAATRRYRTALEGTAELVERDPENPERLFQHAQNVFWVGELARQQGMKAEAEAEMREYKRLADRMVAIEPNDLRWRMEVKYATSNLGILLYEDRRFSEAVPLLEQALRTVEGLAAANPNDESYQKSLAETLAWSADASFGLGEIDKAIALRRRQVQLIGDRMKVTNDVTYPQRAIAAERALGRWLASAGNVAEGEQRLRRAVSIAERLIPREPGNMIWVEYGAGAKLDLAALKLSTGRPADAAGHVQAGCALAQRLLEKDSGIAGWRDLGRSCLFRRAEVALALGQTGVARDLADRVVAQARQSRPNDDARGFDVASAMKLSGDIARREGDGARARRDWMEGLARWPRNVAETPPDQWLKADLLAAVGRSAEAERLRRQLRGIGYVIAI